MRLSTLLTTALASVLFCACNSAPVQSEATADTILLKDYRPVSAFVLPEHHPEQAKFSCIDMHSHAYRKTVGEIRKWDKILEKNNIERVVIHTMAHGDEFERLYDLFKSVSERFEPWCGLNYEAWGTPDFEKTAIADLERCFRKGAKGVGELGDKGRGETFCLDDSFGGSDKKTAHFDNKVYDALIEKCGELGLPVSFHAADPIWMYLPMDEKNDGYMNAEEWKIDTSDPDTDDFDTTVDSFLNAVAKHPGTTFIACHLINLNHDYARLGEILDRYPNLYVDNSARHCETAATPRATKAFYEKYQDRVVFGTDNDPEPRMYALQWRILETEDEHFYDSRSYHWALNGFGLGDEVLQKLYHDNAERIMALARK